MKKPDLILGVIFLFVGGITLTAFKSAARSGCEVAAGIPETGIEWSSQKNSSQTDTLKLTLEEALEIALSENLMIKIADKEIIRQKYARKGTYASLFPQIDLSGNYQRTIEKQVMYMDIEGLSGGLKVGLDNSWSGGATVGMALVSPALWKSLRISGYDVELAVEKARSSRIDLIDQVNTAYYTVLLARDAYHVFKQTYDNAVRNMTNIQQKYEQGRVAEYDLIRANVNVKNAEPNLYDAENSLILAHWQLKALLGLDLQSEISCVGTLADFETEMTTNYLQMNLSLENNSTLKQLDIQYDQLKKNREMMRAQYYPTLNLHFSYQYMSVNNDFKIGHYRWDPYSVVGLSLSIPVFSGGKRSAQVKQTHVSLSQLEFQRLETERNLKVGLKQAADRMNTCMKQYQAARAGVEQSERGYVITMKRYETGEGTLLEINDSQLSLTQAQLNLNQSIYNYLVAKSSLDKLTGKSINE